MLPVLLVFGLCLKAFVFILQDFGFILDRVIPVLGLGFQILVNNTVSTLCLKKLAIFGML